MTEAPNTVTPPSMPEAPKTGENQNTTMAIVAYILFFIPLLTGDAKKDAFVKYHTKQGLVLFILAMALNVINWMMPFYFWWKFNSLLNLGVLVLMAIGIKNVMDKKQEPLPLIGKYSDMFKF